MRQGNPTVPEALFSYLFAHCGARRARLKPPALDNRRKRSRISRQLEGETNG